MGGPRRNRDRRPARSRTPIDQKKRLLVVCEGSVTEPQYLRGVEAAARSATLDLRIIGLGQDPRNVVNRAKETLAQATRLAKADGDSSPPFDEIWCAFDRDSHARFDEACDMSRANQFRLATSVPCIELWLLLHFAPNPGMRDRKWVQAELRKVVKSDGKSVNFDTYRPLYAKALERALQMEKRASRDGEERRNPSTTFHRLTESIRMGTTISGANS